MRKLLIGTTALVTVAGLTASAAFANDNVVITATTEYAFQNRDSKIAAANGSFQTSTSEIGFTFSTKTDSGLTLSYNSQLNSAATATRIDESALTIAGGFGRLVLGERDGVGGTYGIGAEDLIAEESATGATDSATISTGSDIALGGGDNNKVSYHLPPMNGITAGVSFEDSGASATANTATDTSSIGARYVKEINGMTVTLAVAGARQEAATASNTKEVNAGIRVDKGNFSAIFAQTTHTANDEDRLNAGFSASYNMGDGLVIGAYSVTSEDDLDLNEKYSIKGAEAQYTITDGLTAVVNVDNYDYDASAAGEETTSDDGAMTKLTIKAAF